MDISGTFKRNIPHLLDDHECEDKTRYISFIEFIEANISKSDFESLDGFKFLEQSLYSDLEFLLYTTQRIYAIYMSDEDTFLKHQNLLPRFKMSSSVLFESFLCILKSVSTHTSGKNWILRNWNIWRNWIISMHFML
jgi:hypothetical protein